MLRDSKRKLLATGFKDLANLVAASLVFGQFFTEIKFDVGIMVFGAAVAVLFYVIALLWQP